MDLLLNEDEKMIRETARGFLDEQCPPSLVRQMEKDGMGYSPDLWRKAAELGWQGMALPEKYGGLALPLVSLGLILEEVGRAIAPIPLHSTAVASLTIAREGTDAQCEKVLPGVVRGETILTWAFAESDPRQVPETIRMQAVADGGDFILNGTKLFVDNFTAADYCLVACRTAPASKVSAGLTLFIVGTKSPGISHEPLVTIAKDKQSEVIFKDVRVSKSWIIGERDKAAPIIERVLDRATALLCAQMLGAARKDAEMAFEYAKHRIAFDQPIGSFQAIQHLCADMLIWVDAGCMLTYEALWKMDQGMPAVVEVSQAKAFCNERCLAVVRNSQTIHGGIGFMMELDLHLWYRRVAAWTMRLGSAYEHRARIARALLDAPGRVTLGRQVPVVSEVGDAQRALRATTHPVKSQGRFEHGKVSGMR